MKKTTGNVSGGTFNSWEEIAAYLKRGIRTVQRWEKELGLPVHRNSERGRPAVVAVRAELDRWARSCPLLAKHEFKPTVLWQATDSTGDLQFLRAEIQSGLTFAGIARYAGPHEKEKFSRNFRNSRIAYETLLKFRDRVLLDEATRAEIDAGVDRLKNTLKLLAR